MSFTDAVSRISQIQAQIESVQTAFDVSALAATQATGAVPDATSSTGGGATTFAAALAQAQSGDGAESEMAPDSSAAALPATSLASAFPASPLASTLLSTAAATTAQTPSLPASAQSMLTSEQQQFASRLAADTGLDPAVVTAWLLAEESGAAAQSRQSANNNDWLNIGYTDSATYGASDSIWSDPATAADATAGWLKGQDTIPGYGTASSPVQAILGAAGQSPSAQIAAIQQSGWASSGYPDLPALFQQVSG